MSRSARSAGYRAPSLDSEGFIHLSTRAQFVDTANRYYRGRTDLVLLEVDPAALPAGSLVYEASTNDLLFPHLYAALPVDAIIGVHTFQPADDGSFAAPASLAGSQRVPSETRQAGTYWPGWNGELTTIV